LIFNNDEIEPRRMSFIYQGIAFEVFLNTPDSLVAFFDYDRVLGVAANCDAACNSIILGPDQELAQKIRRHAAQLIAAGPTPLTPEDMEDRRYAITAAIKSIQSLKKGGELMGILSDLYVRLADFYLRANCKWSGKGKYLIRKLRHDFPQLADRYEKAFEKAFNGKSQKLIQLMDDMLMPFGGRHFEGYERFAVKIDKPSDQAAA
ncbi:MAG TPA: hypothetical protein PKW15_04830, partial [Alphaproteobacteria bacterium]|nr:hypothetical protein [Alphaproteobacteria bacterium]